MQKQKTYNIAETNISNLGSDLEKKVREAAAATEQAWSGAGKKIGLQIWRIEKFKVVHWPIEQYGSFYDGDSYICLNTYKKEGGNAYLFDVHFWLGTNTSQDEAGTAAYKTVELDDLLGGAPVQHREVQGSESDLFLSYFKNQIKIMCGGVDSGFKHVKPEEYIPKLFQMKGKKKVRITEVPLEAASLNKGDVFVLDNGLTIMQWNGGKSGPTEKARGAQFCKAIEGERKGKAKIHVLEEEGSPEFWKLVGDQKKVKSAEEGGDDNEADVAGDKALFRLSDAGGKGLEFKQVASGSKCKMNLLDKDDVFILDTGKEVMVWVGSGASADEKKKAMQSAGDYLKRFQRPPGLPIARIIQGGENQTFLDALK